MVAGVTSPGNLIERFYTAFNARDGDAMAACYTTDVHFWDPVFQDLHGREATGMWRMLTERATDLDVQLLDSSVSGDQGTAHWRATYPFTQTGRHVINNVHATFRFTNGLISDHRDEFNFYTWSRQALGPAGLLLGWSPIVQNKVRRTARQSLTDYLGA
jgi:ketosteroid isomerase-like protein